MPDCVSPASSRPCNQPCTEHIGSIKKAWLKDCKTGNLYYGDTYDDVRKQQQRRIQVEGSGKLFPGVKKVHPISKIRTIKPVEVSGRVVPGATGAGKTKNGEIIVPVGSRFDNKQDNWKDTEKLMGDPTPDDDPNTVGGFEGNCFGIPIPCPLLAIGVGAVIVLIVALR